MNTIKMRKIAFAILLSSGATLASAADWSDTWISFKHQSDSREPSNANKIAKDTIGFTHASGYGLGSNFLNVDAIKSDSKDPIKGSAVEGAQEIYITYRTNLESGKVTGTPLAFGPFKDVALTAGFDINNKNSGALANKRLLVLGPTFMTKLDKGFLNIGAFLSKETNHFDFGATKDWTFSTAPMLSVSWNLPVQAGLPAKFQGFFNVVGDKGKLYGGAVDSSAEYFSRSSFMWDVGSGMGLKNNALWAGVGYEYWKNKFGNPSSQIGTKVNSVMYMAEVHF